MNHFYIKFHSAQLLSKATVGRKNKQTYKSKAPECIFDCKMTHKEKD